MLKNIEQLIDVEKSKIITRILLPSFEPLPLSWAMWNPPAGFLSNVYG